MRPRSRATDRGSAKGDGALGLVTAVGAAIVLGAIPARAEDRAVVIGIDDYSALGEGIALDGAVADAGRFRDFLIRSWGFRAEQITLLTDRAATSDAILDAVVDDLAGRTAPGDRAVFYFAGMGTSLPGGADGVSVPAIVSHDAGSLLGRIPEDLMADLLDLIPGREVTVIVDAGFSGAESDPGGRVRARGLLAEEHGERARVPFGQGAVLRDVWNAAGPGQAAWEEDGAGIFTEAFLAGQAGAADADGDGEIPDRELLTYLEERTGAWCEATPACAGSERGFAAAFADGPRAALPLEAPETSPEAPGSAGDRYSEHLATVTDAWDLTNAAGLRLSLQGPPSLRIGDTVTLRLQAERPGRLLLIDLHASAGLTVVGPDLAIGGQGAEPLILRFRATEPVGPGAFIGILLDGTRLDSNLPEIPDGDPEEALRALTEALGRPDDGGTAWSAAVLPYEIAP